MEWIANPEAEAAMLRHAVESRGRGPWCKCSCALLELVDTTHLNKPRMFIDYFVQPNVVEIKAYAHNLPGVPAAEVSELGDCLHHLGGQLMPGGPRRTGRQQHPG